MPKTAAIRRPRSSGPVSQSRMVQTPAHGGKRSSRRSIPSPPSSHASRGGEGAAEAAFSKFEEWPLQTVSLKRVTEKDVTTFQLQFSWDSCTRHGRTDHSAEIDEPSAKRRNSANQGPATRAAFTPEEDDLLIKLKNQELSWKEIHTQLWKPFPQRDSAVVSLQARYCRS